MRQRDHLFYERYVAANEAASVKVAAEKQKTEEKKKEREDFYDSLNKYREQRELKNSELRRFSESVYNNYLETALNAVYISALQQVAPLSEESIILAEKNVENYIKEHDGARNIIRRNSGRTSLLDTIFEAVSTAANNDITEYLQLQEAEKKEEEEEKKEKEAEVEEDKKKDPSEGDENESGEDIEVGDADGDGEDDAKALDDAEEAEKDAEEEDQVTDKEDTKETLDDDKPKDKEESEEEDDKEEEDSKEEKNLTDDLDDDDDSSEDEDSDDEEEEDSEDEESEEDPQVDDGFSAADDKEEDSEEDEAEEAPEEKPGAESTEDNMADSVDDDTLDDEGNLKDNKEEMFKKLENDAEVTDAVDIIAKRISDAETEFIQKNAEDKKKIEQIVNKVDDRIKAVTDSDKEPEAKEEEVESAQQEATRLITDIKEQRFHSVFEELVKDNFDYIMKDTVLKENYTDADGKINVAQIVESTRVMYGFLEFVNTIQLEKVNSEYILKVITNKI